MAPSVVEVVQYVGSNGWDQNDDRAINTLPLGDINHRQGVANGTVLANLYRIYPGYSTITQEENETNFNYNSLQTGLRVDNRHGLTTQIAYTWSYMIDIGQNDLAGLSNPFDPRYDRGSDAGTNGGVGFDRRHIFNVSYVYQIPFYLKSGNLAERTILGGWSISGITEVESGTPSSIYYTGPDVLGLGGGTTNRPDLVSKVGYPKTQGAWFSTSSFANPVAPWNGGANQGFGTAGKDAVVGPGLFNWNLSLFKTVPLTGHEGPRVELRFESFNTFNHTQFQNMDTNSADSNFGQTTSAYSPRILELGGKFVF
jgi:hypothetical protein